MSGIVGIHYIDGRPIHGEVNRMVKTIQHRGPDGVDVWRDESVGLGHCMLHTTPESLHASLPHKSSRSGCAITADARIDNRKELLGALRLHSGCGSEVPDSTIILRAYEKWGRDCVKHLLGAFAFVVWDPGRMRLFCAQDHLGIRPLYYYYEKGKVFAFASEIKALLCLESVPRTLNEARIAEHLLAPVEEDVTRTYFKHISRVAPAQWLTVGPDSLSKAQYWALDPDRETRLSSDEEYTEQFKDLFEDAVRVRLRSLGPVGCELSGGLDSSSITCQSAKILGNADRSTLHTFSGVFQDHKTNEYPYIKSVVKKYPQITSHLIRGDERSPLADWDMLLEYLDDACESGNVYIPIRVSRLAQEEGIRVILTGFDGDTTISHGTGYFYQLRNEGRWLQLIKEVKGFAEANDESPRGAVWSWLKGPLLSSPVFSHILGARRTLKNLVYGTRKAREHVKSTEIWENVMSEWLSKKVSGHLDRTNKDEPKTERIHHYNRLTSQVLSRTLYLESHYRSIFNVDARYPFFDKRLVEFCLSLPPDQKIRNGVSRFILRQGMKNILPTKVQKRKGKTDYSNQLKSSLIKYEEGALRNIAAGNAEGLSKFVNTDFVKEATHTYLEDKSGDGSGEGHAVWRVLALAMWFHYGTKASTPVP